MIMEYIYIFSTWTKKVGCDYARTRCK